MCANYQSPGTLSVLATIQPLREPDQNVGNREIREPKYSLMSAITGNPVEIWL